MSLPAGPDTEAQSWSLEQQFVVDLSKQTLTHKNRTEAVPFQRAKTHRRWLTVLQVLLLGWLIIPIRVFLLSISFILFATLALIDTTPYSRLSLRGRKYFDFIYRTFARIISSLFGFWTIKSYHISSEELTLLRGRYTEEFDRYDQHLLQVTQETQGTRPFIVISNHIGNIDGVLLARMVGVFSTIITSKMRNVFAFGRYARKMEYLYYGGEYHGVLSGATATTRRSGDIESAEKPTDTIVDAIRQRSEQYYRRQVQQDQSNRSEQHESSTESSLTKLGSRAPLPPPRLLVFPEGTMTNGKSLLHFHLGAFKAGIPIEPIVLRYPHKRLNPSNLPSDRPLWWLLTFLSQFHRVEEIRFPAYVPTAREVQDPKLYASNVRRIMCQGCNLFHPKWDDPLHLSLSPFLFRRLRGTSATGVEQQSTP